MKVRVKLKEVCDVRDGTHDSPKYVINGYPLITSKNVVNGFIDISEVNYISKDDYEKINKRSFVDDGDIIMPMIGTIGNPIVVEKQFEFAIKNVALIKFKSQTTNNYFIRYLLCSRCFKEYIEKKNRGGTQKFISLNDIRDFEFILPSLNIQHQIADTLDKASEIISMRKQQLEELDNLVKAIFYDMFGDPVTNNKGWKVHKLYSVVRGKSTNGFFARNSSYGEDGNAYIVWIGDIIDKVKCNLVGLKRAAVKDRDIEKYGLQYGDALFCRSSLNKEGIGKCAIVPVNIEPNIIFECHIIKVSLDLSIINPIYFQVFSTSSFFRNQIMANSKTSTMTTISQAGIENNIILIPPLPLQNQFAAIVEKIEVQKALVQKALDESQYLFDCLMDRYFGE